MTGWQLTLVQSRVGRRVAMLFALSGLVPVLLLAGITSWLVSDYLRDREQMRLRALAKESTMASLDRLIDTEERLRILAGQPAASISPNAIRGVDALVRLDLGGQPHRIFGDLTLPAVDAAARARLEAGDAVLLLPAQPRGPLIMVVPAKGLARYDTSAVVAALDPQTLWRLDEWPSDGPFVRQICATTTAGRVLACSDGQVDPAAIAGVVRDGTGAGTFTTMMGPDEWMGAYWSTPIQAHYGVAQWSAVIVTRASEAMAPARALTRTIGLVVVGTLCVILLVSLRQIRHLLDPIARLRDGTTRLARGDFATRVDVRTGDELQVLGEAFNGMAADLERQFGQLHALSVGTLEALARAIDAKSPWTAGHSTRVADVAQAIARALHFDEPGQERIRRGGLLHDIGKIGISADILDKTGPLTAAEVDIIREHPATGTRILEPLPHCADILPMVLQHHERFDGRGYPAGRRGDDIALDARVLMIADTYDAMTSDRPYRRGMPARDVAAIIAAAAGTQFDPAVVEAFVDAFRRGWITAAAPDVPLDRSA